MAKAYYSTVLDHSADQVWSVIRPFDHYAWAGVIAETVIEDGRQGDQFENKGFAVWLAALKTFMATGSAV
jgi:hypothetical protein